MRIFCCCCCMYVYIVFSICLLLMLFLLSSSLFVHLCFSNILPLPLYLSLCFHPSSHLVLLLYVYICCYTYIKIDLLLLLFTAHQKPIVEAPQFRCHEPRAYHAHHKQLQHHAIAHHQDEQCHTTNSKPWEPW